MTTWHDRLQIALTAREKDWPELVQATGKKKPSVYAWKPSANDRAITMNAENAAEICEFLKINVLWLFCDRGASGLENTKIFDEKFQSTVTSIKPSTERDTWNIELSTLAGQLDLGRLGMLVKEARALRAEMPAKQTPESSQ